MSKVETLTNPPITEALIDIRVTLPKGINIERLKSYQDKIIKDFPESRLQSMVEAAIKIDANKEPEIQSVGAPNGYLFLAADKKKIVQARLDGFTFNKLKPYDSWEIFSEESKKLWKHFLEITTPIQVNRIALRYINRIELPIPITDLKQYLNTLPNLPNSLSSDMSDFFMRAVISDQIKGTQAIITETIDQNNKDKTILPFILDVDVFKEINIDPTSEEIWTILDDLRNIKNTIFFESLSDKTINLLK